MFYGLLPTESAGQKIMAPGKVLSYFQILCCILYVLGFAKFALNWTKIKEIKKEISNGYLKKGLI